LKLAYLFVLSLLFSANSFSAQKIVKETIPVNPDVKFSIKSHRGRLNITTADIQEIDLTAVIRHDKQAVVDRVEIDIYSSARSVSVETDYNQPGLNLGSWLMGESSFESPEVVFNIVIPDGASLQIETHRSRIDIDAPSGRVRISSHRGGGRVSGIRDDLTINTHRGSFDVEITQLHNLTIETHRGDITVDIANASDFSVDARTNRGKLKFRGRDIRSSKRHGDEYADYQEGDGQYMIEIDTHRGDVVRNFLD